MNVLIINSCNSNLEIVVKKDDKIFSKNELGIKKHNEIILDLVKEILEESNTTLNEIDMFGAVVGPGSFTGIRVGIATIKAFKDALNKEVRGINNLEYLYHLAQKSNIDIVAIEGSLNSFFVAEKTDAGMHIYPHNINIETLTKISNGRKIGCYEISQQMKDENLNFVSLKLDNNILIQLLNNSKDRVLTPIYYQLSQAESEKIKKAVISFDKITTQDLNSVLKIDRENFSLELNGETPWSDEYYNSILENDNYDNLLIKVDNNIVGFAILESSDEINISRIAISKEYQNQGLGTKFLSHIFDIAKEKKMNLSLEVCEHNINALKLYQKLGFILRRKRKNYYKDGSSCLEMVKG